MAEKRVTAVYNYALLRLPRLTPDIPTAIVHDGGTLDNARRASKATLHPCARSESACPHEAITSTKQMVRGVEKWYVDFERCLPFFNQTHGCAICIAVCPWRGLA